MSANPPCTYDNTYYICSSTVASLILIPIYNLYAIKKPKTFSTFLLNVCGLATSTFDPVLDLEAIATASPATSSAAGSV